MARLSRVVVPETPHHVTQRGNAQRATFETDSDRLVYLSLLREHCRLYELSVLGYCLMPNHVHLIVVPGRPDSMALVLRQAHGRYAAYLNARQHASGHVWQGRYYSCPLDTDHLWRALRYTELNPVRAGLAAGAKDYPWSSAAAHCMDPDRWDLLDLAPWQRTWTPAGWREYLSGRACDSEAELIRKSTHTGRPLGSHDFVERLEQALGRRLARRRGGHPPKAPVDDRQNALIEMGNYPSVPGFPVE